jgi:S-adenosylmethionine-diacylglycerol 3-amino-3-carboxypropyl transferase
MGMESFMKTLNYASCNEDWRSEWAALEIEPSDTILCITGSGDRPLDLLPENPKKIIAMDMNIVQNHLLRLKMKAMEELPYEEYAGFMGLKERKDRLKDYEKLRDHLPDDCRKYWDMNRDVLEKGVIYQGRWENHFKKLALISKILRGGILKKLFSFDDVEKQKKFVEKKWDRWWWRLTFKFLCSAGFSKTFFGDPGFYQFVSREMSLGEYVFEGMDNYLKTQLARDSFMMSLVFRARLSEYDLPPYLDEEQTRIIIDRSGRIEIRTGNILEFMETVEEGSIDKFSLSDVPSFLDQKGFERMLDGIVRSGSNGARFCIRLFLSGQHFPKRYKGSIKRDIELEKKLSRTDRSFAYRFYVGTVLKRE